MQLITKKGARIMSSVGEAKDKIASLYPNLQTWIQKVVPQQYGEPLSQDFRKDLEPLLSLKENFDDLERKSHKMNYMMRELNTLVK